MRLFSQASDVRQAQRIFHGRGQCHEGLEHICIDALWPTLWVTLYAKPEALLFQTLTQHLLNWVDLHAHCKFERILIQHRYRRGTPVEAIWGNVVAEQQVLRKEATFLVRFDRQNIGFFLDIEPGRRWLEARSEGKTVLNLFSYTCVFSVVAHQAGARRVVNVDMSKGALSIGRDNHKINNHRSNQQLAGGVQFLPYDILKSWSRIRKQGPYDLVIIDPPSFQRGSFVAERDYEKVLRRLQSMLTPKADVLACLNAPELTSAFLDELFRLHAPNCLFQSSLPAEPVFRSENPDRALKLRHYLYMPP